MDSYIFWGFVACKQLRSNCEHYIESQNARLLFYVDDDINVQDGKNILSSDAVLEHPEAKIVILSAGVKNILKKLKKLNLPNKIYVAPLLGFRFLYDEYVEPLQMLENGETWTKINEKNLRELYSLKDKQTADILDMSLKQRKTFEWQEIEILENRDLLINSSNYFSYEELLSNYKNAENITYIDAGAYIGDSIEEVCGIFGNKISKIYAFEPSEENIKIAKKRLSKYSYQSIITWSNSALGDTDSYKYFTKRGGEYVEMPGEYTRGGIKIRSLRLDDTINDATNNIFLKMDIEGMEIKAIIGAKNLIRKYHPCMAICLYHRMNDIYDVPRMIKEISPNYKFFLRDGLHTLCYAIPNV